MSRFVASITGAEHHRVERGRLRPCGGGAALQLALALELGLEPGLGLGRVCQTLDVGSKRDDEVWSVQLLVEAVRPRLLKGYLSDPASLQFRWEK